MRPNTHTLLDTEIELTAQELLAPLHEAPVIEVDDIIALETTYDESTAANAEEAQSEAALDYTSEIELTPEQMDAMLEGRWP
jgi:hypothetical protein